MWNTLLSGRGRAREVKALENFKKNLKMNQLFKISTILSSLLSPLKDFLNLKILCKMQWDPDGFFERRIDVHHGKAYNGLLCVGCPNGGASSSDPGEGFKIFPKFNEMLQFSGKFFRFFEIFS